MPTPAARHVSSWEPGQRKTLSSPVAGKPRSAGGTSVKVKASAGDPKLAAWRKRIEALKHKG